MMPASSSKADVKEGKNKTPEFSYSFSGIDSKKVEKAVSKTVETRVDTTKSIAIKNPNLSPSKILESKMKRGSSSGSKESVHNKSQRSKGSM